MEETTATEPPRRQRVRRPQGWKQQASTGPRRDDKRFRNRRAAHAYRPHRRL